MSGRVLTGGDVRVCVFVIVKVGPATFGLSGQYIRHFSSKSQGRVTGKIGRLVQSV